MVGCCKLSLYANESWDERAIYFRQWLKWRPILITFLISGNDVIPYGSPKGTSVLTLDWSECFVFFFKNRSLFFFLNWSWFLRKSGLDFWKSEFVFSKIEVCYVKNREFVFWKSEYWAQILLCLLLLSWNKISGESRGTRGPPPPPRLIFRPNWGLKGRKKLFLETVPAPLLISESLLDDLPPPPPYLWVFIPVFVKK